MDILLWTIRTSTDNQERKKAEANLRQLQEDSPEGFLSFTWNGISSPTLATEERFFLASTLMQFVEQSWRNGVPKWLQQLTIDRYTQLVLSETFPTLSLARKVATILSIMSMHTKEKVMPGTLSSPTKRILGLLSDASVWNASFVTADSTGFLTQILLTLHVFLKELRRKRSCSIFSKLCALLVPAMSKLFTTSASWDHGEFYMPLLYLMKCALRIFGYGVFERDFHTYLLKITWELTRAVTTPEQHQQQDHQLLQCRQRLLEYALKVQLRAVENFASSLSELSPEFFLPRTIAVDDTVSLFGLLFAIIMTPLEYTASEKMVFRSMDIFSKCAMIEEAEPFLNEPLEALVHSPLLHRMLERATLLLADDLQESTLREWETNPERFVLGLTALVGSDNAAELGAEELLLSLTGSKNYAARCLEVEWQVVNAFLASNDLARITAALHAVGLCYYTMSVDADPAGYVAFLTEKLLPLIRGEVFSPNSPFMMRRVVWMIGMWCGSVQDTFLRRQVHAAFGSLLVPSTSTAVLLNLLFTINQFINDSNFKPEELPVEYVQNLLLTIKHLLPQMRTSSGANILAELVQGLVSREVFNFSNAEVLFEVVLPAVYRFINEANTIMKADKKDDDDDDDDSEVDLGSLMVLLQCAAACTKLSSPATENRVWALFPDVVVPCTLPGGQLALMVEDNAWELLLEMCSAVHAWNPVTRDALAWCFENMKRDVEVLPMVVRCAYRLLLLCPDILEFVSAELVNHALELLVRDQCNELLTAVFGLLAVMVRRGNTALQCHLLDSTIGLLLSKESVQLDKYCIHLALLVTWCLPPHGETAVLDALVQDIGRYPNAESFSERIVLLLDVSPSKLVMEELKALLRLLLTERLRPLLTADDLTMVQHALEGTSMSLQHEDQEDDMSETGRDPAEMLLELVGDQGEPQGSPHIVRLFTLFGLNLNRPFLPSY
ncbi:hypothetical protein BCY84_13372 [Trypanosoma cruzi cruzi]|nr:hypothetical protein BCY84_13372 [Trypanosoma cruzi cruzi]